MLHIVKSVSAIAELISAVTEQDEVILIENAVYAANPQHRDFQQIRPLNVYVLDNDLLARGLAERVSPSCLRVDYLGFVALTAKHGSSLTWN